MGGPEHYGIAENLIAGAMKHRLTPGGDWQKDPERHRMADALIAEAQVHATLADAAATALRAVLPLVGDDKQVTDWARAIGVSSDTAQVSYSRLTNAIVLVDEWQRSGVVTPEHAKEMFKALGEVTG